MRAKLQLQFFAQRLALLEAREELIEDADDDGVDAHAFGFRPLLELGAGLGADVDELRVGEVHAGLAGLLDVHFVLVHVAQSKKDDPGKIALYAGFLSDSFAEIERKAQRHAWPILGPALPLTVYLARYCLFGCFLY